jgi:hypothetical protein
VQLPRTGGQTRIMRNARDQPEAAAYVIACHPNKVQGPFDDGPSVDVVHQQVTKLGQDWRGFLCTRPVTE